MGLSNLAWELGGLLSAFLFLTSLVPFFGTLLLLASSSLMSSPSTDGLMLRFPSTLSFPPPAVRLCCFLLWGYWPLSCMKEHAEDCGATLNITQVDRYEQSWKMNSKKPRTTTHTHKRILALWSIPQGTLMYLWLTSWTKPVPIRHCIDLGFMAVSVAASITAITE